MPRPGTSGGGHRSSGGHSSGRVGGGHHVGSSSRRPTGGSSFNRGPSFGGGYHHEPPPPRPPRRGYYGYRRNTYTHSSSGLGTLIACIIIFAIILIFTFLYGIARINDVSMKPAIKDGDLVMYYRLDKRFVSGDVAVFEDNGRNTTGRVVAVAGDTVDITKDGLKINGADR